jgi:hypothetical protein
MKTKPGLPLILAYLGCGALLFALEQIPAEAANKTPLAGWWIAHGALWFSAISVFWSVIFVGLTSLRLNRWEE